MPNITVQGAFAKRGQRAGTDDPCDLHYERFIERIQQAVLAAPIFSGLTAKDVYVDLPASRRSSDPALTIVEVMLFARDDRTHVALMTLATAIKAAVEETYHAYAEAAKDDSPFRVEVQIDPFDDTRGVYLT